MWYLVILVAFGVSTVNGQINCIPNLVSPNLIGGRTSSTFTLQNPCCIAQDPRVQADSTIVTVVSTSSAITNFVPPIRLSDLPLYSNLNTSGFFAASGGLVRDLCPLNGNLPSVIRIGDNVACMVNGNTLFCNGPLPNDLDYRVIQLVYASNGTLIGATRISPEIILRRPRDYHTIDTSRKGRSASMVVITTILPILFALLLALFTSLLFMKCCCCRVFVPKKCQQES
ncbi:uroplakin-3b-like [Dendropsophus ebraccatus]|uniref:uroplakin-3b-like n=1 Tax=Dendropsophus ebraccatus TaxID=150705 RepID=UPI003831C0F3